MGKSTTMRNCESAKTAGIPGMKLGMTTRYIGPSVMRASIKKNARVRICGVLPERAHAQLDEYNAEPSNDLITDNNILEERGGITERDLILVAYVFWDGRVHPVSEVVNPEQLECFARLRAAQHSDMRVKELLALLATCDPEARIYEISEGF